MASVRTKTHLTNGQVYNWLKELPSRKWKDICDGFQEKMSSFECKCKSLYNSVIRVEKRVKLLKQNKSKNKSVELYFKEKFNIPIKQSHLDRPLNASMTEKEKQLKMELNHTNIENKTLKRKLEKIEVKAEQLEVVEQQCVDALDELQKLRNDTSRIVKRKDDDLVETKKALAI